METRVEMPEYFSVWWLFISALEQKQVENFQQILFLLFFSVSGHVLFLFL